MSTETLEAEIRHLKAKLATAEHDRDVYAKAKTENDERFMVERDDARLKLQAAEKEIEQHKIRLRDRELAVETASRERKHALHLLGEVVLAQDRGHQREREKEREIDTLRASVRALTAIRDEGAIEVQRWKDEASLREAQLNEMEKRAWAAETRATGAEAVIVDFRAKLEEAEGEKKRLYDLAVSNDRVAMEELGEHHRFRDECEALRTKLVEAEAALRGREVQASDDHRDRTVAFGQIDRWLADAGGEGTSIADRIASLKAKLTISTNEKNGAYRERNTVVALAARMALALGVAAGLRRHEPDPDPSWEDDWKNVVAIDLPTGLATWHYHDSERDLFADLPALVGAPYDGHTTDEKYRRVRAAFPVSSSSDLAGLAARANTAEVFTCRSDNWVLRVLCQATEPPDTQDAGVTEYVGFSECPEAAIDSAIEAMRQMFAENQIGSDALIREISAEVQRRGPSDEDPRETHPEHFGPECRCWAVIQVREAQAPSGDDRPECPGPDCLMCNGEACNKCGAGCWANMDPEKPCEHDVLDRHEGAQPEATSGEPAPVEASEPEAIAALRAWLRDPAYFDPTLYRKVVKMHNALPEVLRLYDAARAEIAALNADFERRFAAWPDEKADRRAIEPAPVEAPEPEALLHEERITIKGSEHFKAVAVMVERLRACGFRVEDKSNVWNDPLPPVLPLSVFGAVAHRELVRACFPGDGVVYLDALDALERAVAKPRAGGEPAKPCTLREEDCGDPRCDTHHAECSRAFSGCWHDVQQCRRREAQASNNVFGIDPTITPERAMEECERDHAAVLAEQMSDVVCPVAPEAPSTGSTNTPDPKANHYFFVSAAEMRDARLAGLAEAALRETLTPQFIDSKFSWSLETFGPGDRLRGVLAHIRKELTEIERKPKDPVEWGDVILLAMDGASRQGIKGAELLRAIFEKQAENLQRTWPDWRTQSADAPIEHVRAGGEEAQGEQAQKKKTGLKIAPLFPRAEAERRAERVPGVRPKGNFLAEGDALREGDLFGSLTGWRPTKDVGGYVESQNVGLYIRPDAPIAVPVDVAEPDAVPVECASCGYNPCMCDQQ